jgi:hypothetical protein
MWTPLALAWLTRRAHLIRHTKATANDLLLVNQLLTASLS